MLPLLIAVAVATSTPAPMHTTGDIRMNLSSGRFEASICIHNWPKEADSAISLNEALVLAHVRDEAGKPLNYNGWYNATADGEGRLYDITRPKSGPVCFEYGGALPVFTAHDAVDDFKGWIAFDGQFMRASEQAVWLPTPWDNDRKVRIQDTTYRLHVTCDDCALIYMNGAAPVAAKDVVFESETPRPPLLFASKGVFDRGHDMTFVNAHPKPGTAAAFDKLFHDLRGFYTDYLGQSFGDTPVIIQTPALDTVARPSHGWGFATWPTIAMAGSDIDEMAAKLDQNGKEARETIHYIGHESAHYYFGHTNRPHGPYRFLLTESAAEFMSLKAIAALQDQTSADGRIANMAASVAKRPSAPKPLDTITAANQIGDGYRYVYAPLLLVSLDRTIGEARMRAFMRGLLERPEPQTWADFGQIANRAGVSDAEWNAWTKRCVADATLDCISALAPSTSAKP